MNEREFQLLLYCARSRPPSESIKDLVDQKINWQTLHELAEHHGVRPFLHRSLKSVCWEAVPQTMQHELQCFNRKNTQKNLLFTGELLRLLGVFQQNRVPIVTFKGPVVAATVYGDVAFREFYDLDIMVREMDVCTAEDILKSCGYQPVYPNKDYRSAFLAYHGQYMYRLGQTGVFVDLHWRLSNKGTTLPLRAAQIWRKLEQVTIAGRPVPTFGRDDLVLFLAAHGTKEGWKNLIWVCDFAELLRNCPDIDWSALVRQARRSRFSRALLVTILLANRLLDAPVPLDLLNRAANDTAVRNRVEKIRSRMAGATRVGELEEFLNGLEMYDKWRDRLWPIATLLTTRTVGDYQAMSLRKSLWGMYYLTRPFRLARKAVGRMMRMSAG
jgi:hypothetical protein